MSILPNTFRHPQILILALVLTGSGSCVLSAQTTSTPISNSSEAGQKLPDSSTLTSSPDTTTAQRSANGAGLGSTSDAISAPSGNFGPDPAQANNGLQSNYAHSADAPEEQRNGPHQASRYRQFGSGPNHQSNSELGGSRPSGLNLGSSPTAEHRSQVFTSAVRLGASFVSANRLNIGGEQGQVNALRLFGLASEGRQGTSLTSLLHSTSSLSSSLASGQTGFIASALSALPKLDQLSHSGVSLPLESGKFSMKFSYPDLFGAAMSSGGFGGGSRVGSGMFSTNSMFSSGDMFTSSGTGSGMFGSGGGGMSGMGGGHEGVGTDGFSGGRGGGQHGTGPTVSLHLSF
jgi:hypothetical protein